MAPCSLSNSQRKIFIKSENKNHSSSHISITISLVDPCCRFTSVSLPGSVLETERRPVRHLAENERRMDGREEERGERTDWRLVSSSHSAAPTGGSLRQAIFSTPDIPKVRRIERSGRLQRVLVKRGRNGTTRTTDLSLLFFSHLAAPTD